MLLLQVEIINNSLLPEVKSKEIMTLWGLLLKGGWIMLPILLLSILTMYAIIERLIVLQSAAKVPKKWLDAVYTTTQKRDTEGVKMLCEKKQKAKTRNNKAEKDKTYQPIETIERVVAYAGQT